MKSHERHGHHIKIYQSRLHVLSMFIILLLPFIFLLLFSIFGNINFGRLMSDIWVSLSRMVIAYFISLVLAWILAVSFYRGKKSTFTIPVFDLLQSFPSSAALPIAAYFWGASGTTVIFFLVIAIIWPMLFSIISSLKLMRSDWQEAAQIVGLRGRLYFTKFLLPITLPGIITGSIIGLGDGWEALVATEIIVGIKPGMGEFFSAYSHNVTFTALGIVGFLLIIFSINKFIWLRLLDWSHKKTEE